MATRPLLTFLILVSLQLIASVPLRGQEKTAENKTQDTQSKDPIRQLVKAAIARDREQIKDLLAEGADINARDRFGLTPYLAAKMKGNDGIAQMLEVLGAKTDLQLDAKEFVEAMLKEATSPHKPGIAVLIANGDEILYSGGFGAACIEHDVPITIDTRFRIGSVTKQFTAAAILKLQEDGKLSVEDKLTKFIADFPRGDEVTITHLLTHTSGLKNYTSKPTFYETVASQVEPADLIDEIKQGGFDFDPGAKFAYCNSGYFLLGHIVQQVAEQPFGEYLRTTFFEPLGMHDTGVHTSTDVIKREASGYSMEGETVRKALDWDMSHAGGAGNLYSTVKDLHKWNRAVFGGEILSDESLEAAHTINPVPESDGLEMPYGYGWMMDEHRGLKRIGHSGGLQGFVAQLSYYPEHDITVTALHNALPSVPELAPGPVCEGMAEAFLWQKMQPRPKYVVDESVDPTTFDDYQGRYDYRTGILTVTRDGDRLMAQLTGQQKFQVFPSGRDKFFWKVVDAQIEFQRDQAGNVTAVKHSQGIARFEAPRVEDRKSIELSEEELDRFVGKYSYRGLGELTIRRDGKQLWAQMKGQPELKLFAESNTKLYWRAVNAELEFAFDEDGQIKEITHSQSGQAIPVKRVD